MENWHHDILNVIVASSSPSIVKDSDNHADLSMSLVPQMELELGTMLSWDWELSACGYFTVDLPLITSVHRKHNSSHIKKFHFLS